MSVLPLVVYFEILSRALMAFAFWLIARKHLFMAAMVHAVCGGVYGGLFIPIIRGGGRVTLNDLVGAVLVVEALRQGILRRLFQSGPGAFSARLLLMLFVVAVIGSVIMGTSYPISPFEALRARFGEVTAPAMIIALARGPRDLLQMWRGGFWSGALFVSGYVVAIVVAMVGGRAPAELRSVGVFASIVSTYGGTLALHLLLLSAYYLPVWRRWPSRPVWLLPAVIGATAMLSTFSGTRTFLLEGVWILLLLVVFPPSARSSTKHLASIASAAVAVVVVVVGATVIFPSIGAKIGDQVSYMQQRSEETGDDPLASRRWLWEAGWEQIANSPSPLIGLGEGNSGSWTQRIGKSGLLEYGWVPQHNLYLQCLADQGIMGGVLLLAVIVSFVMHRRRLVARGRRGEANAALVVRQAAWVWGLYGMLDGIPATGKDLFIGFALQAAALEVSRRRRQGPIATSGNRHPHRVVQDALSRDASGAQPLSRFPDGKRPSQGAES